MHVLILFWVTRQLPREDISSILWAGRILTAIRGQGEYHGMSAEALRLIGPESWGVALVAIS